MDTFKVDLTNCDREPIHIPGKVQSHGFLVAVDASTHDVTYLSQNIDRFIQAEPKLYLGKHINELEQALKPDGAGKRFTQLLSLSIDNKKFDSVNPFNIYINKVHYFLIINAADNHILLEFERASTDLTIDFQKSIGRTVAEILSGKNLTALLNNAAHEVRKIIQYDRVMVYKFHDDGHGEVIAEEKKADLQAFMGLHYPASDIPKQARELYKINLTRIIADVNTVDSSVITFNNDEPLDLTQSVLRAVSPIHIQYLKNMGVASSFSLSLMAHGELWGLVACHNYTPRFINYKARDAAKLVVQILSSALEYRQDDEDTEQLNLLNAAADELSSLLKTDIPIVDALTKNKVTIGDITTAGGAAILMNGVITILGNTPDEAQVADIITWLQQNISDPLYHTNQFSQVFEPAKDYIGVASGILACTLSKDPKELIIWFKPEQFASINWAGNPNKPIEVNPEGMMVISPRLSFEAFTQRVKNTSQRWTNEEITVVIKLREEIIYAVNRRANEIRKLNEQLQLAYEELDTFSYTISHDLRSPLSSIKTYAEFLLKTNKNLDDQAQTMLQKIVGGANKMNMLITEILNYSQVGRVAITFDRIDMATMISDVSKEVINSLNAHNLELVIGETPDVYGDGIMIMQAFTNLINNAIKYSAKSNPPHIEIKGVSDQYETTYSITDNGIGIDVNYFSRVFELFKRMDNVNDYEGTGVGLAIVKRIIEKHQARIWFESKLNQGTTFYISFRNASVKTI